MDKVKVRRDHRCAICGGVIFQGKTALVDRMRTDDWSKWKRYHVECVEG